MDILKLKINDIKLKLEKTNQEKSINEEEALEVLLEQNKNIEIH